jgi:hypothetical protein
LHEVPGSGQAHQALSQCFRPLIATSINTRYYRLSEVLSKGVGIPD